MDSSWLDPSVAAQLTFGVLPDQTSQLQSPISGPSAQRSDSHWDVCAMSYQPQQGAGWAMTPNAYTRSDPLRTSQSSSSSRYDQYQLRVLQHPKDGKVAVGKEKDRKPLDPPPLVELAVDRGPDSSTYLQSPYTMVLAYLEPASGKEVSEKDGKAIGSNLTGTTASSLHRVKNMENKDIAAFVFPDLAVKVEGSFRLRFVLMVMEENGMEVGTWLTITECYSDVFTVHSARSFPGMAESTSLTRMFADQGIRLRLRKDSRQLTTKKQNHSAAYRLAGKRSREIDNTAPDDDIPSAVHRRPIASPDRPYFEGQGYGEVSDSKRQRTTSAGQGAYSLRHNLPASLSFSYSGIGSMGVQQGAFLTTGESESPIYTSSYHTRDIFGSGMTPTGLPRSGSARLDPQIPSYQGDVFASPNNQAPADPYSYSNAPGDASALQQQNQPPMGYYHGSDAHLPTLNRSLLPGSARLNTSPQANPQATHTPVSSTGSPVDPASYTHTGTHFSSGYMAQASGSFDQGTLRNHGISTPVTGNMATDQTQSSFVQGHHMPVGEPFDYPKATHGI
ncbi:VosA protein [Seiridium cupressi]